MSKGLAPAEGLLGKNAPVKNHASEGAKATAQQVVGDVQHVVRFVIRLVLLQQVQVPVDGFDQPDPPGEQVHRPDPAGG